MRASGDGSTRIPRPLTQRTKLVTSPTGSNPWLVPRGVTPNCGLFVANSSGRRSSSGMRASVGPGAVTCMRLSVDRPSVDTMRTSNVPVGSGLTRTSPRSRPRTPCSAIPIEEHGVRGRLLGEVRVRPLPTGTFDVRIVSTDGRSTDKRMHVTAPGPTEARIPEELRRPLEFATNRPQFGVTPLGTSHGFDPVGDVTSFVLWVNGRGILVDPSPEALIYLKQLGVATADVPYVFLTHIHADHAGGLMGKQLRGSSTSYMAQYEGLRSSIE